HRGPGARRAAPRRDRRGPGGVGAGPPAGPARPAGVGAVICHDEHGAGTPVVLLHGVGLDRALWERCVPALARRHRVLVPDLPGHGRSGPVPEGVGLADLAEAVAGWMPARAHLVGFSLGALVAQELSLSRPDLVDT